MQPSNERVEKFKKIWDIAQDGALTADQAKKFVDLLIGVIKTAKENFASLSDSNSKAVNKAISRMEGMVEDMKAELNTTSKTLSREVKEAKKVANDELNDVIDQFNKEIERVENSIPEETDLTSIEERIEEVKRMIPDGSVLLSKMDELKKSIEEDMKKFKDEQIASQRAANGVSNLRIQQAFKYILKTEQPSGAINGTNTEYTVTQDIFAVLSFSLNGETIAQLPNYTVMGKKITFSTALPAVYSGKDFEIKYI
jgi:hypothetical protein